MKQITISVWFINFIFFFTILEKVLLLVLLHHFNYVGLFSMLVNIGILSVYQSSFEQLEEYLEHRMGAQQIFFWMNQ